MTLKKYKRRAIRHLFEYLDARAGKVLIAYESAYHPIVRDIEKYALAHGRADDIELCFIENYTPEELYLRLTASEKFLCAFNPTWGSGFTEYVSVMSERATSLANKAYTLSDMSSVFYDVFQACPRIISGLNLRLIRTKIREC